MLLPLAPSLPREEKRERERENDVPRAAPPGPEHHSSTGGHYLELIAYFIPIKLFRRTKHATSENGHRCAFRQPNGKSKRDERSRRPREVERGRERFGLEESSQERRRRRRRRRRKRKRGIGRS